MKLPIYQVDAFTRSVFAGNPAAVMPLERWVQDELLQKIAMENNLSETAFFVPKNDEFELRWFTPMSEVRLCGHATLAAAHTLFEDLAYEGDEIRFQTHSGMLRVSRDESLLTLDFPPTPCQPIDVDLNVCSALGATASEALIPSESPRDLLYVYEFEEDITRLKPDFAALKAATELCVIVTAPGNDCDFVSRFFAPRFGIDEDPVTGSAHCALVPYWSKRLNTRELRARQLSERGGELACRFENGRVFMAGTAVTFMRGHVVASSLHRAD
ncbi:MAG: PhzF family phenazine biosynthesis protein [Pseudomonadota bacterium]